MIVAQVSDIHIGGSARCPGAGAPPVTTTRRRHRLMLLATLLLATVAGAAVTVRGAAADMNGPPDPATPGPFAVATVDYALGDTAFTVPDYYPAGAAEGDTRLAPIELTGTVRYPKDLRGGPRPLVLLLHGMWSTCVDRQAAADADAAYAKYLAAAGDEDHPPADPAEADRLLAEYQKFSTLLGQWPCATGTPPMPSFRGYDYLSENLASHGFVVVSISANGINAGSMGDDADRARAALINKHLAMWQELSRTDGGPLAGKFTDPTTHATRNVRFAGKVDLTRVGLMGHSRGGRAVMWQAADKHRSEWPAGVQIKAVVPLAAAGVWDPDDPEVVANYLTTAVPILEWGGTCDYATGTGDYADLHAGKSRKAIRHLLVHGANHDFLNTQWSPSSGQLGANDDADAGGHPQPGQCVNRVDQQPERQLTEAQERLISTGYLSAFFQQQLQGRSQFNGVLDGRQLPYRSVTTVEVKVIAGKVTAKA